MLTAMAASCTLTAFLLTPFSAKAAGDEKPATYRAVQRAGTNANVFYELGMAEAMGHHPILIAPDARHLPFDKAHCRCHLYGGKRLTTRNLRRRLVKAVEETLAAHPKPAGNVE